MRCIAEFCVQVSFVPQVVDNLTSDASNCLKVACKGRSNLLEFAEEFHQGVAVGVDSDVTDELLESSHSRGQQGFLSTEFEQRGGSDGAIQVAVEFNIAAKLS